MKNLAMCLIAAVVVVCFTAESNARVFGRRSSGCSTSGCSSSGCGASSGCSTSGSQGCNISANIPVSVAAPVQAAPFTFPRLKADEAPSAADSAMVKPAEVKQSPARKLNHDELFAFFSIDPAAKSPEVVRPSRDNAVIAAFKSNKTKTRNASLAMR
jgi:hypothetical protein